ncbi:MAG: endonuclease [Candidatus Melainabacteria bacterium HGW-Melainabacteria-1]|nr:MAG: endonuclease [Candidatus Melainabacteria bacterium HGW-Melainabacteria-1]
MLEKHYYVYLRAQAPYGVLYLGVTSDLIRRTWEHKSGLIEGFTKRYHVHMLVWYEVHISSESAILREKQLKKWKRQYKLNLIDEMNPDWKDLYSEIVS